MKSSFIHTNINVMNLDRSIEFYGKALGLRELRRKQARDGSFIIVFLGDQTTDAQLELTWLRDRHEPYNLGDNEWHIAFRMEHPEEARSVHENMGCICYENTNMGIYFIADPDGYWIEIIR